MNATEQKPRILLVDDDDDMVEICSRLLPRKGYELIVARNAERAVETARTERPDLILMDMRMPLSDSEPVDDRAGLQATRKIRALPELDGAPIIALTGHMMTKFRESIVEAGCADWLAKPIDNFSKLLDMIDRHLPPA